VPTVVVIMTSKKPYSQTPPSGEFFDYFFKIIHFKHILNQIFVQNHTFVSFLIYYLLPLLEEK